MIKAIPKWVWNCYSLLWKKYTGKSFTFKDAGKVLKYDSKITISTMLYELKNAGWINVELNQEDTRKRRYTLIAPEKVVLAVSHDARKKQR